MGLLRKKSFWQRLFYSRLTLILLVIASVFIGLAVYDRYVVEREVAERRYDKEEELSKLQTRKAELAEKVEYLQGDQGVEAEIRKHFDVAKEGEKVVILTNEEEEEVSVENRVEITQTETFWQRLFSWMSIW